MARGLTNALSSSSINFDNYATFGYVTANENIKSKDPIILNVINDGITTSVTTQHKLQAIKSINKNTFISIFSYEENRKTYIALQYFVKNNSNWNALSPIILETIDNSYATFSDFGEIFITSNNNLGLEVAITEDLDEYKVYLITLKLKLDTYSYSNYLRTQFGNTCYSRIYQGSIVSYMLWDGMLLLFGYRRQDSSVGNVWGFYSADITNINNISITLINNTESLGIKFYSQIFKINDNKYLWTGSYYNKYYKVVLFYKGSNNALQTNFLNLGNPGREFPTTSIYYYLESDANNGIFYFIDGEQGILMDCQVNGNSLSGGVIRDTNNYYKNTLYCKKYSSNFMLSETIDYFSDKIIDLLQIGYMRQDMNFNLILQYNSYNYPYELTYSDSQNIFKGYYVEVESNTNINITEYPSFLYGGKDPYGYSPIIAYNDAMKGDLIELKIKVKQ